MDGLRINPVSSRARRNASAGSALVYLTVVMVALVAFSSLAVDLGRVYVARAELQLAADAAARYGAAGMATGVTTAIDNAVNAAADNTADGSAVAIDRGADVELGNWDSTTKTFTALSGSARDNANAIRVTARRTSARGNAVPLTWASVIGTRTCDVTVTAIARKAAPAPGGGFMGLTQLEVGNNTRVNGYDSDLGAPGGSNVIGIGNLGSNAEVRVGNNTSINGDVALGPAGDYDGGASVTGSVTRLSNAMNYPPTETPDVSSAGSLILSQNQTLTLAAGTYNYTTIDLDNGATLEFSGPATLYVTEAITFNNNGSLLSGDGKPSHLRVRLVGAARFEVKNNATIVADVYGPQARFEANNDTEMRGALIASEVKFGNNAQLYYDRKLDAAGAAARIMLVK